MGGPGGKPEPRQFSLELARGVRRLIQSVNVSDDDHREPKKPTGITGPVHISFKNPRPTATFTPFDFHTSKADVEMVVAEGFLSVSRRQSLLPYTIRRLVKNPTDDYDFTLDTSTGSRYLELLEVAPKSFMMAGYQGAPSSYKSYDFARSILEGIMTKSSRYDSATSMHMILLLYETHWTFAPSAETLALLQYFAYQEKPKFEEIYWYHPITPGDGIVEFVYPTPPDHWKGFDPEKWRESVVHNLAPDGWMAGRG